MKQLGLTFLILTTWHTPAHACIRSSYEEYFTGPLLISLALAIFGIISYILCKYLDKILARNKAGAEKVKSGPIKRHIKIFVALFLIFFWLIFPPVVILNYDAIKKDWEIRAAQKQNPDELRKVMFCL